MLGREPPKSYASSLMSSELSDMMSLTSARVVLQKGTGRSYCTLFLITFYTQWRFQDIVVAPRTTTE